MTVVVPMATSFGPAGWWKLRTVQWQAALGSPGERVTGLDEIEQSISLVLLTPLNSVPFRPHFGSRLFELVDEPVTTVKPAVVKEVLRALAVNEPRARLLSVTVSHAATGPGHLEIGIEWQPIDSDERRQTTVEI